MWRKLFNTALPKVHDLETDCIEQLEFWGTLGGMDENVLERMLKEHKRLLMMLGHMNERETYLHERRAAMNDPVVLDLNATVEADRKRNFTPATLEKRKERMKKADGELLAKVEVAELFVGKSVYDPIDLEDD
jgi:hypothetical protein